MIRTQLRNRALSLACFTLFATPLVLGQQAPPAPPAAPSQMPPAKQAMMDRNRQVERKVILRGGPEEGPMGIVPPGTWWKNPETITALTLTADQQKKMDEIFRQNRLQLIDIKASLEKEQINLEPLLNANPVESTKALAEISKIADLRADLEKANAKMLLGLRTVLTADQWTKLQAERHNHRGAPMMEMERRGMGKGAGAGAGGEMPPPASGHNHAPNAPPPSDNQ